MNYEIVIGLEVHVELATASKMFCGCKTLFGSRPNSQTCPVCLAHPGSLPTLNKKALEYGLRAALALNCTITEQIKFDRKNYFYPDTPKAYQISQYDSPIGKNGWIQLDNRNPRGENQQASASRKIGISHMHLEEDAGKLTHYDDYSLVDLNRAGIPLLEIVSEPELRSPAEARMYLEKLRLIILYTGISDVKMEEGSLRCDANISLRPVGSDTLGTKTEIKNLNSFRHVEQALLYEAQRQHDVLIKGGTIEQQSMRWLEDKSELMAMRSKEKAHDYRYFPEPDLVPFPLPLELIAGAQIALPTLPDAKIAHYKKLGLTADDAYVLISSIKAALFFEECIAQDADPIQACNWITGELFAYLKEKGVEIDSTKITPTRLGELLKIIKDGTISSSIAKRVFKLMLESDDSPTDIVNKHDLVQIDDMTLLQQEIDNVLTANPHSIADFRAGKDRVLGFVIGQVMKATKGKADPARLKQLVQKALTE